MNNNLTIGSTLFLAGFFVFLKYFGFTNTTYLKGIYILSMFYGLTTIISTFQNDKRARLFFATVMLNVGIILHILDNFEILNHYNVILPSVMFVIGSGLFMLFLENISEIVFLIAGIFFLSLSAISILLFNSQIIQYSNKITLIFFDYWPLFLVLLGVILVLNKPRKLSSPGSSGDGINASE